MPIVSAVLTLAPDLVTRAAVQRALGTDPRITLGPLNADRLPVVLETSSRDEDRALWERVADSPGVLNIELAFADFSDLHRTESAP
jgi:nitrate reductase NapAB chaperone NapD